jgi:hypothetical protein
LLFPRAGVSRQIREFDPDVPHITAEGPFGWRFASRCAMISVYTAYRLFPDTCTRVSGCRNGIMRGAALSRAIEA